MTRSPARLIRIERYRVIVRLGRGRLFRPVALFSITAAANVDNCCSYPPGDVPRRTQTANSLNAMDVVVHRIPLFRS